MLFKASVLTLVNILVKVYKNLQKSFYDQVVLFLKKSLIF